MQEAWDVVDEQPTVADLWTQYNMAAIQIEEHLHEIEMKYEYIRELREDMREIRARIEEQGEIDLG